MKQDLGVFDMSDVNVGRGWGYKIHDRIPGSCRDDDVKAKGDRTIDRIED